MRFVSLDVVMPSLGDMLERIVRDNSTGAILLLVAELLIAAGIVIGVVLRKHKKSQEQAEADSADKENEQA